MRIQYKIVVPFTLLFVVATLLTALVSISLLTRNLESRVADQLDQASKLVSRADFALNPSILASVKAIIGADIVTYKRDGAVLATTLPVAERDSVIDAVVRADGSMTNNAVAGAAGVRDVEIRGRPYKVTYRPLSSVPEAVIAVLADTSDLRNTRNTIAKIVLLIAALIVILMSLIGHIVARGVTAPVSQLVEFTKKVAAGERSETALVTSQDEVGVLAGAFNSMVEQLRQSEEKAVRQEKLALTGLLAARVAHEVRNPLLAIKMQGQLLKSKIVARAQKSEIELILSVLHGIDRVEWVVRGMLDLASTQELHVKPEDIREVLDEVLEMTGPQLRHRKITIQKAFDPNVTQISLDRSRFKLALLNLIVNASEAMTQGGFLEIAVRRTNDSVKIEIADDGVGISPDIRDRLFDPFVTTKPEGVGLGLVNTKNIVERHRGTIKLVPRDKRGTLAIIELPLDATAVLEQEHG